MIKFSTLAVTLCTLSRCRVLLVLGYGESSYAYLVPDSPLLSGVLPVDGAQLLVVPHSLRGGYETRRWRVCHLQAVLYKGKPMQNWIISQLVSKQ